MTPHDIKNQKFDKSVGGYKVDDVSNYLNEVATYVEELLEDKAELEDKLEILAEKLEEYREDEDSLRAALIGAQKLGDSVVRESKKKAEAILAEANEEASRILDEANERSSALVGNLQANIEKETKALHKMEMEVAKFKGQILSIYKKHIELIKSIPYQEVEPELESPVYEEVSFTKGEDEPSKDFVVSFDEVEEDFEINVSQEEMPPKKKASRFGTLRFGEEYNLTRKGE